MPNIILVDDWDNTHYWENFLPLCFTKPISHLVIGHGKIYEKWEKGLKTKIKHFKSKKYLAPKYNYILSDDNLIIRSNYLPYNNLNKQVANLKKNQALIYENELVAIRFEGNQLPTSLQNIEQFNIENKPVKLSSIWHLFQKNNEALSNDFEAWDKPPEDYIKGKFYQLLGDEKQLYIHPKAKIETVIFNTTQGAIYIDEGATIMDGAILRGPLYVGKNATIKMGAKIYGDTTIAEGCKVGGEISNTIFSAFSNKGHDGYLGNSVIGEWCNLGADTNSSNLKNNYGKLKLWNYAKNKQIQTDLQFCGLLMGDHSKSGINTMFNTATCVGVSSNIFGSGFPAKRIPSFCWGGAENVETFNFEKAIEAANNMMKRRNQELLDADIEILKSIYQIDKPQ